MEEEGREGDGGKEVERERERKRNGKLIIDREDKERNRLTDR